MQTTRVGWRPVVAALVAVLVLAAGALAVWRPWRPGPVLHLATVGRGPLVASFATPAASGRFDYGVALAGDYATGARFLLEVEVRGVVPQRDGAGVALVAHAGDARAEVLVLNLEGTTAPVVGERVYVLAVFEERSAIGRTTIPGASPVQRPVPVFNVESWGRRVGL